jgi:hypothetical protein
LKYFIIALQKQEQQLYASFLAGITSKRAELTKVVVLPEMIPLVEKYL